MDPSAASTLAVFNLMDEHQHKRFGPLFAAGLAVTACLILYTQRDLSQYAWPIGQHRPPALSVQRWTLKFAGAQHLQLSSSFQAPEPELDWKQARSWLRDRIETLAAADNQTGWHGAVEPTRPRPQAAGHVRRLLRSAHERRRLSDGGTDSLAASAASAPTAAQRPDHPMSQPADTSASAAPAAAAAGGNALGVDAAAGVAAPMLPTALLAVPTANVWNKTELMVASLAAVNDGFELLVRAGASVRSALRRPCIMGLKPGWRGPVFVYVSSLSCIGTLLLCAVPNQAWPCSAANSAMAGRR